MRHSTGPIESTTLAGYGWNEQRVGIALTVGGIAGILAQTPAGALVDRLRSKRALITAGIVALAAGALLVALVPTFWSVMSAQVLIGGTSSIFGPAICAVSLGIVGHRLFDIRQGRNQTFNSAGNVVAAVSMGTRFSPPWGARQFRAVSSGLEVGGGGSVPCWPKNRRGWALALPAAAHLA